MPSASTPSHYLSLLLMLPLAGALGVLLVPRRHIGLVRWLAGGVALGGLLLSIPLWFWYNPKNPDFQLIERVPWIPSIGAEYFLGVDGISALLILLAALVGVIAVLSSWGTVDERANEYYCGLLVVQAGVLGAFMALDLLLFFVFWILTLLPTAFLIGVWGSANRVTSAYKYVLWMVAGSVPLLVGILALYVHHHRITGVYTFDVTVLQQMSASYDLQWWVFLAFLVAFAIAVPLIPFHTWLPDAHTHAPMAVSVVLGAVILKLGTYGFLRFSLPMLPDATRAFVPFLAVPTIAGIVYGALAALSQKDWKRVVAWWSVSQMGIAMVGMLALNPEGLRGSVVQLFNHGIWTAGLLLLAGAMFERRGTREIAEHQGLWKVMPAFAAVFLLMTMASIGVPALNGFVGHSLILRGAFLKHGAWAAAAAGGMVLGAVSLLRLFHRTMIGAAPRPERARLDDLNVREWATLLPLVGLAAWIGLYPAPVLDRINVSTLKVAARVDPSYASEFAAACDTTVTPEMKAASPANQFLAAAPCGPDGQPLSATPADATTVPGGAVAPEGNAGNGGSSR